MNLIWNGHLRDCKYQSKNGNAVILRALALLTDLIFKTFLKLRSLDIWQVRGPTLPLPPVLKTRGFKIKFKTIMANHKATKKDMRQSSKRREKNKYYGKTTRNAIRDLQVLTEKKEAGEKITGVLSMIDKLANKGVIHKNKAANLKSALVKKVNALSK